MREYVIKRGAGCDYWDEVRGTDCLARTVHEEYDLIDIGVMDKDGNPIMARKKMDAIGFVRFKSNA